MFLKIDMKYRQNVFKTEKSLNLAQITGDLIKSDTEFSNIREVWSKTLLFQE